MSQAELGQYLSTSDAFLFPSLEPFGLAPIEAMSAGIPVLAYQAGGALDYIEPDKNGIFFDKQTVSSLSNAMQKFKQNKWSPKEIKKSAEKYDQSVFKKKMRELIDEKIH